MGLRQFPTCICDECVIVWSTLGLCNKAFRRQETGRTVSGLVRFALRPLYFRRFNIRMRETKDGVRMCKIIGRSRESNPGLTVPSLCNRPIKMAIASPFYFSACFYHSFRLPSFHNATLFSVLVLVSSLVFFLYHFSFPSDTDAFLFRRMCHWLRPWVHKLSNK